MSKIIEKNSKKFTRNYEIRKIIICFLSPFLMDTNQKVIQNLLRGTLQLKKNLRNSLLFWFKIIPKQCLQQIITTIHHFITMRLYVTHVIDEDSAYGTRVLGIINDANEVREGKEKINYQNFYNDAVNNCVDLGFEFTRWIRKKKENRDKFESFSFLDYPFILDPSAKTQILRIHAKIEQNREVNNAFFGALFQGNRIIAPYCILKVDRQNLIQSTLNAIVISKNHLKKPLKIIFTGEEGVDEGGVKKEFFQLIIKELFNVNYGMFKMITDGRLYWFNLNSNDFSEFRLMGQIIGLAIYNKVIMDIHFPIVVYKKLLNKKPTLSDICEIDPELGRGLKQLLIFEGNVEETYCRSFEVDYEGFDGTLKKHNLVKNGQNFPVTKENRAKYVELYLNWMLVESTKTQFEKFREGFHTVVDKLTLKLLKPEELELLICGSPNLDFNELEKACKYGEGYNKNSRIIKDLWKILKSLSLDQKKKFLTFCTGSDRVPIKGLTLVIAKNGEDPRRLPTAHTCYNILLLPEYRKVEDLKRNLITAIENGCIGFGLQ